MTTLIKISQLPSATSPLSGDEVMTVVQGGVTKKINASAINDLIVSPVAAAKTAAETAAANAEASATSATTSASLAAAQVSSASTYAVNSQNSATSSADSADLAQEWATKTSGEVVTGQGYGAKKYAQDAATSAASIGDSVTLASASATSAATSETNALTSKSAAATSASTASAKATEAAASATSAATSAATATIKASDALSSATAAATSATNASTSASTATTKASDAAASATIAGASATNAATSETNALSSKNSASSSATTATTQAGIATTKAGEASTSATNAAASASAAATSEANALTYKNTAGTSADTATTQAGIATSQAETATTQAGIATTKAGEAATSASAASVAQAAAESARDSTLAAFDSFDDRYLGAKSSDPTTDNDGNALVAGSLYYCTATGSEGMRVYTGSAWVVAYVSGGGYLVAASNLSDLSSASTARTNLGLATVAATGAYGDLTGKPTLFSGSYLDLTNKPSLFSGVYADLTGKPTIPTVPTTVSSFTNDSGYLTSESDPVFTAHAAYGVTTTKLGNWNTAYGWGNHASAGYLTGITSGQVTTALGYTPYNSTNPNGYTTNTGTVTSVGGTGSVAGLSLSGTVTTSGNITLSGTLSASIDNITDEHRLFNNMGDGHSTISSFDAQGVAASTNFGWRFIQGSGNGPGTSSQYYSEYVGLGNEYAYNQYGMQIAYPRNVTTPYLSLRYQEGGAFGAWQKISAGYADTAGSANSATSATSATYLNSNNYITSTGSSGNANTDFQNTPAYTVRYNGDSNAITNSPGGAWWFIENMRHSNSSNYWGTQIAWGWEDNANRLATRNVQAGTFGSWVYYINSSNVGSYALPIGGGNLTGGLKEAKVAMGANDIALGSGNYFSKTISGATTLTVSSVPATGTAASFILDLTNGGAGTITWWSGVKWAGGTAPTLTASGRDVLGFFTHDGGTTWTGLMLGKDVK